MPIDAGLGGADCDRLCDGLVSAGYDVAGVQAVLGDEATAALGRGERVPALRATGSGSPVETLVRLFLLGTTEPEPAVAAALVRLPVSAALAGGLVEPAGDGLRAGLDLRAYGEDAASWWVVADLGTDVRPGPVRPDHVSRHRPGRAHPRRRDGAPAGGHGPRPRHPAQYAGLWLTDTGCDGTRTLGELAAVLRAAYGTDRANSSGSCAGWSTGASCSPEPPARFPPAPIRPRQRPRGRPSALAAAGLPTISGGSPALRS